MTGDLILAIDQGTTSTRAIAFDRALRAVSSATRPLEVSHPQPGWVEQDPEAIIRSVAESVAEVLEAVGGPGRVVAAGLDNQGETVVAWDAETLRSLAPAIVWQCRRSLSIVERLREAGLELEIRNRTGLPVDPYYSASKLTWYHENLPEVRAAAAAGRLRFGTVDAWVTARLGRAGAAGRTDTSTASRTQLVDLRTLDWDEGLLRTFGVARTTLPSIGPSAGELGALFHPSWGGSLRLTAMACDQQAALAGHGAFGPGAVKATYGTGVFVLANAGASPDLVDGVETSVAWTLPDESTAYVLQGGVFTAGALVDWLRDDLGLVADAAETEALAGSVDNGLGLRFLPAFVGLGAPWRPGGPDRGGNPSPRRARRPGQHRAPSLRRRRRPRSRARRGTRRPPGRRWPERERLAGQAPGRSPRPSGRCRCERGIDGARDRRTGRHRGGAADVRRRRPSESGRPPVRPPSAGGGAAGRA